MFFFFGGIPSEKTLLQINLTLNRIYQRITPLNLKLLVEEKYSDFQMYRSQCTVIRAFFNQARTFLFRMQKKLCEKFSLTSDVMKT